MISRVKFPLEQPEYSALLKEALREMRTPNAQAHYFVRQELERRGYQVNEGSRVSESHKQKQ